ncbi:MAG: right-handed parallel beta-helix repeat-containing protein [Desulfobulbaceae bacterium]
MARVLVEDAVWEGAVTLEEDLMVAAGASVTVRAGTVVTVSASDSTKTDPEYMAPLVEITVRGTMTVEGTPENPVVFKLDVSSSAESDSWAGIIVDGGMLRVRSATIRDAEAGIWIIGGRSELEETTLTGNRYGLVAQRQQSSTTLIRSTVTGNEYGLVALNGAEIVQRETKVEKNSRQDILALPAAEPVFSFTDLAVADTIPPREIGDEVLLGDTVWQGRIRVTGRIRIPAEARLIILPGTIVEFTRTDTNGDGIGENGLMLQGVLVAKGTAEKPIIFRSAEENARMGDWDALNIINSDGARSLIEYSLFENAYRGLHFHFSNVIIQHCVFRNNYRGVQFQESAIELRNNEFHDNISGIQARDSEIVFRDNLVAANIFGANFLRAHLTIRDNRFGGNLDFGLKVREGYPSVAGNTIDHNRFGLMFSDTTYGRVTGNLLQMNSETGLSVRAGANMEISGNFVQGNGVSGITARDSLAVIRDNHVSRNGERGIGVISFRGPVSGNVIIDNGLYAIAAEDAMDVDAPGNWYGDADLHAVIYDREDDPKRGRVEYEPVAVEPPRFTWPLNAVPLDTAWAGRIVVERTTRIPRGTKLEIVPGTQLLFGPGAGLESRGIILAEGTEERRILFTAAQGRQPGSWGEVSVEYGGESRFTNCDFRYATWGLHSHFTPLPVTGCTFMYNIGGMRFRSGPVRIEDNLFSDNDIGLRAYLATAEIRGNVITRNRKGIFVREQGGGLLLTRNNIYGNTDYNIWVGDFNTEDIRAPENWWGTDRPEETFFDARREPGIGSVLYEPALDAPLELRFPATGSQMTGNSEEKK